jgi:hypothetical protein
MSDKLQFVALHFTSETPAVVRKLKFLGLSREQA